MGIIIPVIILILAMLIQPMMQLTPGVFSIFYHYALGKFSSKKADDLCLYFLLGAETFVGVVWMAFYLILYYLVVYTNVASYQFWAWLLAGVFVAEAVVMLFFYYRKSKTTELFISRGMAKKIGVRARKAKNRSDAFVLGFVAGMPELIFTMPVYLVAVTKLIGAVDLPKSPVIILAIVVSVIPLLLIRRLFRSDHNLAEIEKKRVKMKGFFKIGLAVLYLLLAGVMVYIGVRNG